MNRLFLITILASFLAGLVTQASATEHILSVIDGDTLRAGTDRLRLLEIDAPEIHSPRCPAELQMGRQATTRLRQLLREAGTIQVLDSGRRDRYGRHLVHLRLDGRDAGETLLAEGLAVPWRSGRAA